MKKSSTICTKMLLHFTAACSLALSIMNECRNGAHNAVYLLRNALSSPPSTTNLFFFFTFAVSLCALFSDRLVSHGRNGVAHNRMKSYAYTFSASQSEWRIGHFDQSYYHVYVHCWCAVLVSNVLCCRTF